MFKGNLYFRILLDYQTKIFTPLKDLGTSFYDKETKKFEWIFPISEINKVQALLGKPIEFEQAETEIALKNTINSSKEVKLQHKYGQGFVKVEIHPTMPNYFLVTTVREQKPQNTIVSFDTVKALWKAIRTQNINEKVLTGIVANNYCKELGIVDFNTYANGEFNWKYFSGSRKHYLVFYAGLKVLCHYGVIEHQIQASQSGIIKKLETWDLQAEI